MRTIVAALLALLLFSMAHNAYAGFLDNGDQTVTDLSSTLMWQQCTAPASGTNCATNTPTTYIWDNALAYCNGLTLGGHTDWRLPNIKELHSIVDVTKTSDPAINISYFPGAITANYWSSTTFAGTGSYAWYVQFKLGVTTTSGNDKNTGLYVRCVRGG